MARTARRGAVVVPLTDADIVAELSALASTLSAPASSSPLALSTRAELAERFAFITDAWGRGAALTYESGVWETETHELIPEWLVR